MVLSRILFLLFALATAAFPQAQSNAGDLQGSVLDQSGAVMESTRVSLLDESRGFQRDSATDGEGRFHFAVVPPGRYRLRLERQGFSTKVLEGVEIRVGDTVNLEVRMEVGNFGQQIDVMAEAAVVDTERIQQASTIEFGRIRDLPINRRNYLDFALLSPATADTSEMVDGSDFRVAQTPQSGISFGGGNGRGNGFYVDGVESYITSGGVRLTVSQEAVQEFQINRNTSSAEFGWASGGTVNIVTRSGSNAWHGNLFGFLRHRSIQARNYFDPGKSAFTRAQSGATIGGPLRRDKSFIFAAYERLDRQETGFVPILQDKSAFTTLTTSQQQLFGFMAASGNPQLAGVAAAARAALTPALNPRVVNMFTTNSGTFPFSEDTQNFSARFDHRFSDSHSLYMRANTAGLDQPASQFGALVAYNRGRAFKQYDGTVMLSDSMILGSRWVLENRLMFNYNRLRVQPTDPFGPEQNVTGYGLFGRDIFLPFTSYERHYQIMQNWSYTGGRHNVKLGFDINPVRATVISETFFSGRFSFGEAVPLGAVLNSATNNPQFAQQLGQILAQAGRPDLVPNIAAPINALQAFSLGLPTFYQQGFGDPNWIGWGKRYAFYAQDSWRASRNLTLSGGVRYDLEVNEAVVGTDPANFSPRLGFAWSPGDSRLWAVRGGYGIYYMPTNTQIPTVADTLSGKYINQVFVPLTGVTGINNPQTGRPTTSADIYQGLLRTGVLGVRSITAADLSPYGVRVGPGLPLRVEFGSDKLRQGYAQQTSFEIERAIGSYAVSAGYNFNRTLGIARITGRNLYYTGQFNPNGTPVYGRFDPTLLQKNIFTYDGNSNYHAAILQVQKRFDRNFSINAHYTFSKAIDDVTDYNSDFSPMDQLNKRAEKALSAFHHAHRIVVNALYKSPLTTGRGESFANNLFGAWNISPIFQANSWRPFNVLTGADINGDGYVTNDRPYPLGRNMGQGPGFISFDMRLSRRFPFGRDESCSIEFIAEGFNLANHTNFKTVNNTVGVRPASSLGTQIKGIEGLSATAPLAFTSAQDPRQFQFGMKIYF